MSTCQIALGQSELRSYSPLIGLSPAAMRIAIIKDSVAAIRVNELNTCYSNVDMLLVQVNDQADKKFESDSLRIVAETKYNGLYTQSKGLSDMNKELKKTNKSLRVSKAWSFIEGTVVGAALYLLLTNLR